MSPTVSICMPHLNSGPFVHDRMRSIVEQTLDDWELIIVDSQSDDGSLAVLEEYARKDARIHIHQAARDGIYSNLNRAIAHARGRYINIATSDDTMEPQCLDELVAALEAHPECGVAHCRLAIIDENGEAVSSEHAWESYAAQKYFGSWLEKLHVRRAPHDGLLHFRYFTVFTSLTQLLVRREVYERLGGFPVNIGSHADFAWGIRVGLSESIIHVPRALATWRRHDAQATRADRLVLARAEGEFRKLASEALDWLDGRQPELAAKIRKRWLLRHYCHDELKARQHLADSKAARLWVGAAFAARQPRYALSRILNRSRWSPGEASSGSITSDVRALMPDGGLVDESEIPDVKPLNVSSLADAGPPVPLRKKQL